MGKNEKKWEKMGKTRKMGKNGKNYIKWKKLGTIGNKLK